MAKGHRIIKISRDTPQWHEAFFRHAQDAFAIDFRQWSHHAGWSRGYEVAAFVEGDQILSTVGCTRTALSVADDGIGKEFRRLVEGLQLGCVATIAGRRGKGLGSNLLHHVLKEADRRRQAVILFSNPEAASFYPQFGFKPARSVQYRFQVEIRPDTTRQIMLLDVSVPRDRHLLIAMLAGNASHPGGLSARPDASTLLWYLFDPSLRAVFVPDLKALVIVEERDDVLHVKEWLGHRPTDIRPHLGILATRAAHGVAFGFCPPSGWLPPGFVPETDPETRLFVRGLAVPDTVPLCFPELLRT